MIQGIEEREIVLCVIDRIIGTNVFVKIPWKGKELEGTINFSEISPGRIRNIRDFVVPKKRIICKILRISGDRIELSLRRVTQKEQKEIKEKYKQEKSYEKIIESVLKEKSKEIIKKINQEEMLYDFFQEAKENSKKIESFFGKENSKKILEIINNQKQKKFIIKKEIFLKTDEPEGIELIKNLLKILKEFEIKYIAAGRYVVKKESEDLKKENKEIHSKFQEIEKEAKRKNIEFSIIKE